MKISKPIVLCIIDGYGLNIEYSGNAIYLAKKPNLDYLANNYPHIQLQASGVGVGLPASQMGNSEVGHVTIGAGRIVYQSLTLVSKKIEDKVFFTNENLLKIIHHVKNNNSTLNLIGLLSDGGVHSHIDHLFACLKLADMQGVQNVSIHAFLDGRDVHYNSALTYIESLSQELKKYAHRHYQLSTVGGRFYGMDRDKRWDRIDLAINTMLGYNPLIVDNFLDYVNENYKNNIFDEFIKPASIKNAHYIADNDGIICFNFRPDRMIQLASVLTNPSYEHTCLFVRKNLALVSLLPYAPSVNGLHAFENEKVKNSLGEILAERNYRQLRIAETEKYAHVTYFFDGGEKKDFKNKTQILINSPKVSTYDLKPEMSALEVCDALISNLKNNDVVILNFANCDMVGHTGKIEPTIKAVETVDFCVGQIYQELKKINGTLIVTADHGNADYMLDKNNMPVTSHSINPVPFIFCSKNVKFIEQSGTLADIAPTILAYLQEKVPNEMTGKILIKINENENTN